MARRAWRALALGSALALSAPSIRADERRAPPTDLIMTRGRWTQACGDAQAVKRAAVQELGYDPFDDTAARKLRVSIGWREGKLTAEMDLRDEAGKSVWVNVIATTGPCRVLVDAVGFSIALQIHPKPEPPALPPGPVCPPIPPAEPPKPPPAREALPSPEPPPPRMVEPPSAPTPPEVKQGLSFRGGAMVWGGQVTTDRAAVGVTVDLGLRYKWFGGAIEGRGDPPLGVTPLAGGGSVNFARATGALLLCMYYEWFVGCAKGEAGRLLLLGSAHTYTYGYGAAGVRLGLDFPVVPRRFFLRLAGEVLGPIDPTSIVTSPKTSAIQVAGTNLGLGLGVLFTLDKP